MTRAIVEHFLKEEGGNIFNAWLEETQQVMSSFAGYRSIRRLQALGQPERTILEISFDNFESLKQWSASEKHETQIKILRELAEEKYYSFIYEE